MLEPAGTAETKEMKEMVVRATRREGIRERIVQLRGGHFSEYLLRESHREREKEERERERMKRE